MKKGGFRKKKIMFKCKLKENVQGWDHISKHLSNLLQDIYSVYGACEDTKQCGTVCEMKNRSVAKSNLGQTDSRFQLQGYKILACLTIQLL